MEIQHAATFGDLRPPSPKTCSAPFFRHPHYVGGRKWDGPFIRMIPSDHGLLLDDLRHYAKAASAFGLGNREMRDRVVVDDIMVWCQLHHYAAPLIDRTNLPTSAAGTGVNAIFGFFVSDLDIK